MRIVLCNDDGIHAPGIVALHAALAGLDPLAGPALGEVFVVAPLTVQSATGHGITFRQPLVVKEVEVVAPSGGAHGAGERGSAKGGMRGVAVDGRPADCVKLALSSLWPERFGAGTLPDLVVSGMNMGANVGINVLYSGTCAAALEAAFLGVPSIAVSLHHGRSEPRYDVAARHARKAIDRVLAARAGGVGSAGAGGGGVGLRRHECININVPITEREGPTPGMVVCPMNTHGMVDAFDKRTNPLGETYFWSAGTPMEFHATEAGSDVQTIFEGKIAITPLMYDLTDRGSLGAWREALGGA
jgi:5'-nucleotidase